MALITFPDKSTDDDLFASEINEIKSVVNENASGIDSESVFLNKENLAGLLTKISELDSSNYGSDYIGLVFNGDSMAGTIGTLAYQFMEKYGVGAYMSPNLGTMGTGIAWVFTGGAYASNSAAYRGLPSSYTYFKGAHNIHMPVGSTATCTCMQETTTLYSSNNLEDGLFADNFARNNAVFSGSKRIEFLYLNQSGGGTLTFSFTSSDGIVYPDIVVDTNDPTTSLESVDFVPENLVSLIEVTVTCSVADSEFVGFIGWKDKGVVLLNSAVGGTEMELWANSYDNGNLSQYDQDLINKINPAAMVYFQRASDSLDPESAFTEYYNACDVIPKVSHMVIGEPCIDPASNDLVKSLNDYRRDECETRKWFYLDLLEAFGGDSTVPDELGWTSEDSIHQYGIANRVWSSLIWNSISEAERVLSLTSANNIVPRQFDELKAMNNLLHSMNGCDLTFGAHSSWLNQTLTGSATVAWSDQDGIQLQIPSGTQGSVTGRLANCGFGNTAMGSSTYSFSIVVSFYRGINVKQGGRMAWIFGDGNGATLRPEDMTNRGFAIEHASNDDIGSPHGSPARLVWHTGTELKYSEWFDFTLGAGSGAHSSNYSSLAVFWNYNTSRLSVYVSFGGKLDIRKRWEVEIPEFKASNIFGHFMKASIWDIGSPVAGTCYNRIRRVSAQASLNFDRSVDPFGAN